MLKMSKLADYGTVVLTAIARAPQNLQSAAELAATLRVPAPTVAKVLKILTREGLVVSVRGAKGGYLLARPADEISIAEIVNAMEGPLGMTECCTTPGLCAQEGGCPTRANWQWVNQLILQTLERVTLAHMLAPAPGTVDVSALKPARGRKRAATLH
jgi:FeS assembly SUF system regulator